MAVLVLWKILAVIKQVLEALYMVSVFLPENQGVLEAVLVATREVLVVIKCVLEVP